MDPRQAPDIPGTTKLHRLEENLAAAELTLTADQISQLDTLADSVESAGDRYSKHMMQMIDR